MLRKVGLGYFLFFVALMLFLTLSVANIIAGVFVSDAIEFAKCDREITLRGQMLEARQNMNDLHSLWCVLDVHQQQSLTRQQFHDQMRRPAVKQCCAKCNLDSSNVDALFNLIDVHHAGAVDMEEFIVGCMRVKGMSSEVDTGITVQETNTLTKHMNHAMKTLQTQVTTVQGELQSIAGTLHRMESVTSFEC